MSDALCNPFFAVCTAAANLGERSAGGIEAG
jgi:hypothetical protein